MAKTACKDGRVDQDYKAGKKGGVIKYYIGVDHYREYSYISVMDKNANVVREGKIANTKKAIEQFLGKYSKNSPAALEARRNWTVMHDWLKEIFKEVKLVNPLKGHTLARDKTMRLKTDAEILANLLRCGCVPEAYVHDKDTRTNET